VTASSSLAADARRRVARAGLTISLLGGAGATIVVGVAGLVAGGNIGHGLLLFTPWLIPLLVQDYWRVILFRENRGRAAAINDASWLVFMALLAPFASRLGSDWVVVAVWAGGAAAGSILGVAQTGILPASLGEALRWWRSEAWPLGRWLASTTLVKSSATYATVFVLVSLLGAHDYGGLEAVTVLFGPLSLIANALAMPGLPALSRALVTSRAAAMTLSLGLGALAVVMTTVYVAVLKGASLHGGGLLTSVFGGSFSDFAGLVWPVAVGQLLTAATVGFSILLTAERRGRAILTYATIGSVGSLVLSASLAYTHGVTGAAWGLAGGLGLAAVFKTHFALRAPAATSRTKALAGGTTG
jgi:O-antigen/teichoic acid export membrane protein